MKYIKFIMSTGDSITLPIDKAERVLNSPSQIVRITRNGEWTGETINKAHIVLTKEDTAKELESRLVDKKFRLKAGETKVNDATMRKLFQTLQDGGLFQNWTYEQWKEKRASSSPR